MGGKAVAESKWRWSAILTLPDGRRVFLKRDRTKGWSEFFKYFFLPSKGRKEWFIAHQLEKRNLNIPKPLGWMERVHRGLVKESYYISEAIGSGVSLIKETDILRDQGTLMELAKLMRKIHDSGLFHRDLHAGNFLWDGESFFLTDLHRAKIIRALSINQRLWNLSHLFHSLRSIWGESDQLRFLEKYFREESISCKKIEEYLQRIHSWMDLLQKKQWRSRTKRCLKESSEFSVKKEKGVVVYCRKDFLYDRLRRVIEDHLSFVKERASELAKHSPEVMVSLLDDGENRICVKQFCYPDLWSRFKEGFRLSKGLRAWVGGNGLGVRGISSIRPLALLERESWFGLIESFFVMEASETGEEMDRYIFKGFDGFEEKRLFVKDFTRWLSQLHQKKIYHQDMKTCNIIVSKDSKTWKFRLLDLEDVLLDEKVDEKKLFKNLIQLNTSTPKVMRRNDRFRFFKEYLRLNPIVRSPKRFLRELIEKSHQRGLTYVSPQGLVEEK